MPSSVTLVGNVVADPKPFGKNNVEIRVANQEGKDKTIYMDVKFLNNYAVDVVKKYVKKGSTVFVAGRLDEEHWGEGDNKRSKVVCIADQFSFVGGGKSSGETSKAPAKKRAQQPDLPPVDEEADYGEEPPF